MSHFNQDALQWLNQLWSDLDVWPNNKYGEDTLHRMEWEVERYNPALQQQIRNALASWALGDDPIKADFAVVLLTRLRATDQVPALEQLREQLLSGKEMSPYLTLADVGNALKRIRDD